MTDRTANARRDLYQGFAKPAFLAALVILLALTLLVPILTTLHAAGPIIVNNTTDPASTSRNGFCTLREAIDNANAKADTTAGDCVAGTGTDTINFSVSGTITLVGSGLPEIQNTLTIDGTGQEITVDGANSFQVLVVNAGATLNVNGLTIAHGNAFHSPYVPEGGGILNLGGSLTVTNSTFSGSSATDYGGGILNNEGSLTVTNSTFSGNSADQGGGIENYYALATPTVTNSTFSGNSATDYGGGIYNVGS